MQVSGPENFTGTDGGPPAGQAYKRAVYKQPPKHFSVQVLPAQKHGSAYSYGMLITPLQDVRGHDRRSIYSRISNGSSSSGSGSITYSGSFTPSPSSPTFSLAPSTTAPSLASIPDDSSTLPLNTSYEVWRRWEDCLIFQDTLETQYALMAREKRSRLMAGKGVKKNGVYTHADPDPVRRLHRAASFESLPPGPDPASIAKDVHAPGLLPRLTKKGTLFRASKETIDSRAREFEALIEALLREENSVPTLIQELRDLRVVRDFFGFWRRDHDRLVKVEEIARRNSHGRNRSESIASRASSVFSGRNSGSGMYFSASNLSLQLPSSHSITSESTISAPSVPQKGPRKPGFMQGMSMIPPHSPSNTDTNGRSPTSPEIIGRRRAQTLDDPSGNPVNGINAYTTRGGSLDIPSRSRAPITAPVGGYFNNTNSPGARAPEHVVNGSKGEINSGSDEGGSTSDTSVGSPSPRRHPEMTAISMDSKGKEKVLDEVPSGPIIVSLEEGEDISFFGDDEESEGFGMSGIVDGRANGQTHVHEHLIPREGERGLQDLTIREEGESDTETEGYATHSEEQHSDEYSAYWSKSTPAPNSNQYKPRLPPTAGPKAHRRSSSAASAFFFGFGPNGTNIIHRPPTVQSRNRTAALLNDFDARSVYSVNSVNTVGTTATNGSGSSTSTASSDGRRTPLSRARAEAAHADALRALTGGKGMNPQVPQSPAHANLNGITSKKGWRESEASILSSDTNTISESGMFDDEDDAMIHIRVNGLDGVGERGTRQFRPHESMASVRTFMTTDSAEAVAPMSNRFYPHPSVPITPNSAFGTGGMLSPGLGRASIGNSIQRPASAGSTLRHRISSMTVREEGEDLLDSFFSGMSAFASSGASPAEGSFPGSPSPPGSAARWNGRDSFMQPDYFNRSTHRPSSPGLPVDVRSSVMTTDTTLSSYPMISKFSLSPSSSRDSEAFDEVSGVGMSPNASPSQAESMDTDTDESFGTGSVWNMSPALSPVLSPSPSQGKLSPMASPVIHQHIPATTQSQSQSQALAVKGIWKDHIVAFRVDHTASLSEIREKLFTRLLEDLAEQREHAGITTNDEELSPNFMLGFKPPAVGRVQTLKNGAGGGRARSSSVSSANGAGDRGSLRVMFSEREWSEAVRMCAPGAKLVLHVLDG